MGITEKGFIVARLVVGENDLYTKNRDLAEQWHPKRNGELTPYEVTTGSQRKSWWICEEGHEWEAAIFSRVAGYGCPYCSGRRPIVGSTDLATVRPELAAQWHPTKNSEITPQDVTPGSQRKSWWICEEGHEWEAAIFSRVTGCGCPYCSGQRPIVGSTDLATIRPELAAQWHPTKNSEITPQDVTPGSNKKAYWRCGAGHEWEAIINSRSQGCSCPYCAGRIPIVGSTDLATVRPELAAQWHPLLNKARSPRDVTANANKKVWWMCPLLHEWEARISDRSVGKGCPYCAGKLVFVGFNDLGTIKPDIAAQWHPTRNGVLTPQDVTTGLDKKIWWICAVFHEWEAAISSRSNGNGCPYCSGQRVLIGFNDLATVAPKLAAQWHPTRNQLLTPKGVTRGSDKKAWWVCHLLHEWEAAISNRFNGTGCPKCFVRITEKSFREALEKFSKLQFESDRIDLIRFSRKTDKAQIDMLNDDLNLAIEYDGEWTHGAKGPERKTLERKLTDDKETTQALVDSGRRVIRIREHAREGKLPFIPIDAEYEANVFQISYKSFGKDKDDIEELVQRIIEAKADWFKVPSELILTT